MTSNPAEWMRQADYDMETAAVLMREKRFIYTIFLSHLAIEKSLKGLYIKLNTIEPPKTHSLIHLVELLELTLPEKLHESVFILNRVSIPTRYPSDIDELLGTYDEERTRQLFTAAQEVIQWLKSKY